MAEKLTTQERLDVLTGAAANRVMASEKALADAKTKFASEMEEYGVEYAMRWSVEGLSKADQELTFAVLFARALGHEHGGEKAAWLEVRKTAMRLLPGGGGSSLFARADEDARRQIAVFWLESAAGQLEKLGGDA